MSKDNFGEQKNNREEFDEGEMLSILYSIDEEIINENIDKLFMEKGVSFDSKSIKEKSMNKLNNQNNSGKRKIKKALYVAAAIACTLLVSTVYAEGISKAIQSIFNKTIVYNSIVDGDAYYLAEEYELKGGGKITELSVSKGRLYMEVADVPEIDQDNIDETLIKNVSITSENNMGIVYKSGGYGVDDNNTLMFSFINESTGNYDIVPFEVCQVNFKGEAYDILLTKGEKVENSGKLSIGETPIDNSIAQIAAESKTENGVTTVTLIPAFEEEELSIRAWGANSTTDFKETYQNLGDEGGTIGSGTNVPKLPIYGYDEEGNEYELKSIGGISSDVNFEIANPDNKPLMLKIPEIQVQYKKEFTNIDVAIPESGKVEINEEIDFGIQKAILKSIERTSEDTVTIVYELNTGDNKSVSITSLGDYSSTTKESVTEISDNQAISTIKIDSGTELIDLSYYGSAYAVKGGWVITLS